MINCELDDPGRPSAEPLYRLVTTILDPDRTPARELAALSTERWAVEISIKETKIYQGRPNVVIRSRKPDGVDQELYGFAAVHYAVRWLLHQAALGRTLIWTDRPLPVPFAPCGGSSRGPRAFPPVTG